jgi:hypothetical protein
MTAADAATTATATAMKNNLIDHSGKRTRRGRGRACEWCTGSLSVDTSSDLCFTDTQ